MCSDAFSVEIAKLASVPDHTAFKESVTDRSKAVASLAKLTLCSPRGYAMALRDSRSGLWTIWHK